MTYSKLGRIFGSLTLITLLGLLLNGCGEGKSRTAGREARTRGNRVPVSAMVVRPQLLNNKIFTTGTLLANEEVELRPEISGRVTGVYFEEGGRVQKGQLLLKINDSELKAELKGKEIEEKLAADDEQRKRGLFDIHGISQEEYDKAVNSLKMIQAQKEVIQSQLAETEIVAPFDGVIGLRYVSEGSYVTDNMLVATMQDIDPMKVEFSVPEKYARQIDRKTSLAVTVGDSPQQFKGQVYAVESKIDLGTRTIKARATIPNPGHHLIPGSFAKVEISLAQIPNAILIPAESVIPEINGEKVFVYLDGKVHAVSVKTGIRTENDVQITEGLNPLDTLVISGILQLADGKDVEIKELRNE